MPGGEGFPRLQRLTRGADIRRVANEGKPVRARHVEARHTASPLGVPRVGFVVPRYKQSAVDRNRLKRRLRELVRRRLLPILPPLDVVLRVKPSAYRADFAALQADVDRVVGALVPAADG